MNKKGQADVMSLIVAIPVMLILLVMVIQITNVWTEQKCAPYLSELNQKKTEIDALNQKITLLEQDLNSCKSDYNRLITEEVTKKDIEEIKQDYNLTKTEITLLNQKFETVNNNFVKVYHQLFFYFSISVVINLVLILLIFGDLIAVSFFKVDIKKKVARYIWNKLKKIWGRLRSKKPQNGNL